MCESADSQSKPEIHGFLHEFMLFKNVGVMSYDCPALKQMCESADSHRKPDDHGFVHEFMLKNSFKNIGVIKKPVIYSTAI